MRGRAILLVVPSLAMAIVGVAMFGPGAARPFVSAEVWGGPLATAHRASLRVLTLERLRGIDSARDIGEVLVRLSADTGVLGEARCTTDASGACDVLIPLPETRTGGGPIRAEVYALPSGRELAAGELAEAARWGGDGAHRAHLTGTRTGAYPVSITARRGIFVAPFRDELVVQAVLPLPYRFSARAAGADLDHRGGEGAATAPDPQAPRDDAVILEQRASHDLTLGITPLTHAVDLDIEVSREGTLVRWAGALPVVPGAMWLDPVPAEDGTLRVLSAVPRALAYASVASADQRWWGGTIPLSHDAAGFEAGVVKLPAEVRDQAAPLWLTLSSDPRGTGSGTVGWPLRPEQTPDAQRERAFRDRRLLDGMPWAEQRDQQRRIRARTLALLALVAAACVEGALLAQIAAAGAGPARGRRSWARLAVAVATVVLAFSAVGLIVMWKTSS